VFYETICPGPIEGYRPNFHSIVVRDLISGSLALVSVPPQGHTGIWGHLYDVSADGRFALFAGGSGPRGSYLPFTDLYVRDLQDQTTTWIAKLSFGSTDASISADGQTVAYTRARTKNGVFLPNVLEIFVYERSTGLTTQITHSGGGATRLTGSCNNLKLSDDGRFLLFDSSFDDLVNNDANGVRDVFYYDRGDGTTVLTSVDRDGAASGNAESKLRSHTLGFGNAQSSHIMSGDGRYVVFKSSSTNLVAGRNVPGVFIRDTVAGTTDLLSTDGTSTGGMSGSDPLISADGKTASFWQRGYDYNNPFGNPIPLFLDRIYARDLHFQQTALLNSQYPNNPLRHYETCRNVDISGDGRFVLFSCGTEPSGGQTLYELFLTDRRINTTYPIAPPVALGSPGPTFVSMSSSGTTIAFQTQQALVAEDPSFDPDVYVYQIQPLADPGKTVESWDREPAVLTPQSTR
jgi:Tol biopolymer transport system component